MSDTALHRMWIGGMLLDLERLEQMAAPAWTPRVAAALFERIRLTEAIVADLANCYRPADADYGICLFCDANPCAPTCPHRRAVEATTP